MGVETNGKHFLVDPFISGNPLASKIDINQLPADYILLTHAHYDHVMDVEVIAQRTGAVLIANHEIIIHYQQKGFKGHELNIDGSWTFDFGKLKMVFATHSSSFSDGSYGGNPAGFILESEGRCVYLAGDTGLTQEMKLFPLFHDIDLAVLPVGGNFTMGVEEAVIASDFVECDRVLGVHYDTVESIQIDQSQAKKTFSEKGKELLLLEIGSSVEV